MQQLGEAEVRIFIENLHKFKVFGGKRLIHKFSDKGWKVISLNKLLKKLRDFGSMTRRMESVVSFYKVQYEHTKRNINWACTCFYFKFLSAKNQQNRMKYDKDITKINGVTFLRHSVKQYKHIKTQKATTEMMSPQQAVWVR